MMKNVGKIVLILLSILMSTTVSIVWHVFNPIYITFAFIHMCISWLLGARYDQFKFLSYHDPLTGIYNRLYAYENIDKILDRAKRKHKKIGIINIDINNFKDINDTYGHHYGDLILKELT